MARANAICNTAREIGAATYLAPANFYIKSLKKTAPPAVPVTIQTAPHGPKDAVLSGGR